MERPTQIAVLPTLPEGWAYHEIQERSNMGSGPTHWFVNLYTPTKPTFIKATGDSPDLSAAIAEAISKIPEDEQ
jgi:hypothetical protein